jgi:Domain of unknown function (DUF4270)
MKKIVTTRLIKHFLFLLFSCIFFCSCEKTKVQFGQDFIDNSYSNIILVDTITAELSTVFNDSIPTSGSGVILAGNYSDNFFGSVTARSFFEVSPPIIVNLPVTATFDSLELIMRPNKSYYGDTTFKSPLEVHQLTSEYFFPLYQSQFFNSTDFDVDPAPLGSSNSIIYPHITDSISIRLSDALGENLFALYKSNDYILQTTPGFLSYFKGLQITPSPAGGMHAIYGFNDSVVMRLHYHETDVFLESKFIDFPFYNGDNKQFNQVKADKTGTPVAVFNSTNKEISSATTGDAAFIQPITGFMAKIKFPTLRSLLLRPDYVKILKAQLVVHPIKNSYQSDQLPPALSAYTTDQSNILSAPLVIAGSTTSAQTGNLVIDPVYNENTNYTYDVTTYLQQQILVTAANQNGLILAPPQATSLINLNRAIIGNQKNSQGSIQLKVYYVSVNP